MPSSREEDERLKTILSESRTLALVGASSKQDRPSHRVMAFLQRQGVTVIPVNPGLAGQSLLGVPVYASLADIPSPFQLVDIFRNADAAGRITDEAIDLVADKGICTVWMQEGIVNEDAARRARGAGLNVVMDRCTKKEWSRLMGDKAEAFPQ